ncbi:thioredoxin family protein [Vibrio tapetis subsp. quintayensis]|uniref:thioredoxin family protein n=1 Tax=Vibrio tapetis TaxID=52443 RepID=UPI0025B347F4|nr:thioredoxin family protein [Vibrio tapetis]MDN3682958.1 thioredoxin family protein [Vibrio tapetis subsp. quintayensis]
MKTIQVFGSGCKSCLATAERINQIAQEIGVPIKVEKITGLEEIMNAGVMTTPGVAVDGVVKHTGSVPTREQVLEILI